MNLHDNILSFNKHHLSHTSIFYNKLKGVFAKKERRVRMNPKQIGIQSLLILLLFVTSIREID